MCNAGCLRRSSFKCFSECVVWEHNPWLQYCVTLPPNGWRTHAARPAVPLWAVKPLPKSNRSHQGSQYAWIRTWQRNWMKLVQQEGPSMTTIDYSLNVLSPATGHNAWTLWSLAGWVTQESTRLWRCLTIPGHSNVHGFCGVPWLPWYIKFVGTWDRTRSTEGRATYSSTMGLPAKPCAPGILVLWTLPPNPLKKSQVARLNSTNSVETHQTTEIQCWESLTQRRCEGTTYSLRRTDAGLTRACTETSCALRHSWKMKLIVQMFIIFLTKIAKLGHTVTVPQNLYPTCVLDVSEPWPHHECPSWHPSVLGRGNQPGRHCNQNRTGWDCHLWQSVQGWTFPPCATMFLEKK